MFYTVSNQILVYSEKYFLYHLRNFCKEYSFMIDRAFPVIKGTHEGNTSNSCAQYSNRGSLLSFSPSLPRAAELFTLLIPISSYHSFLIAHLHSLERQVQNLIDPSHLHIPSVAAVISPPSCWNHFCSKILSDTTSLKGLPMP